MNNLTIRKIAQAIYELPFMWMLCFGVKNLGIPNDFFYKYVRFNGKFRVDVESGVSFDYIHSGGGVENEIFWKGLFQTWEKDTGWIWQELCNCSEVIFDVGANNGVYSLVAKAINPNSKIYAFEPSKGTFSILKKNMEINGFDINLEALALSKSNGKQVFYDIHNKNQYSASLSSKMLKENPKYQGKIWEYEVQTRSLSSYIKEKGIERIDLIKIDVELHEAEVIEGLGQFLDEFKPIVIIEILKDEVASKLNKIVDLNKYEIFSLKDEFVVEKCKEFQSYEKEGVINYLFFHKDKEDLMRLKTSLFGMKSA